jgi:hypothetical protein
MIIVDDAIGIMMFVMIVMKIDGHDDRDDD